MTQQIYIQPLTTVSGPQAVDGKAVRLGGSMVYAREFAVILRRDGAVAERMLERTPGVTRLIDRMERKGWVTRERCTEDRRRVWCRISEPGLSLLDSLDRPIDKLDEAIGEALDDSELDTLIGLLDRIRAHVGHAED